MVRSFIFRNSIKSLFLLCLDYPEFSATEAEADAAMLQRVVWH